MPDKFLRDLVHGDFSIGKHKIVFLDLLLTVCITGAAVMIRNSIFGIAGSGEISDGMRLLLCGMDLLLGAVMAGIIWKTTENRLKTVGIYALTVIWPAIAGNSALNGGREILGAVLLMIILFGIVRKELYSKGIYWSFVIETCGFQILYADLSGEKLTNCWPNLYTLFSETGFVTEYGTTGKLLTIGILLMIFYYISKKKPQVSMELLTASGLFFTLLIVTFYPFMNYRSGLLANVFALLVFVQNQKKWYVPVAMCTISYVSYGYFYNGTIGVFFWIYALALIALMLDAGVAFYKQLQTGNAE